MSFIWLLCKVILAIEGYNIIVDYIITKKAFNDIKKEYNFLIKPKYNIRDNLSFNILIDIISIHTKLKYYHEFKSLLIEEFLKENIIVVKIQEQTTYTEKDKDMNNCSNYNKENDNIVNNYNNNKNKNKPKILVKKKEDRRK